MGALERKDIVTDEALTAFRILTADMQVYMKAQDDVIANSKKLSDNLSKGTTGEVKQSVKDLTLQQQEYLKVQKQIEVQEAKNNDQHRAAVAALQKLKDENKAAMVTSDAWTKSVTAQNSSLKQIEDALNKNRQAWANLRNEQARNGKEGTDLLKVIQNQVKEQDRLRTALGQSQQHVGGYTQALEKFKDGLEKATPAIGKIAPEALEAGEAVAFFGKQLLKLLLNPIVLAIVAIAAAFQVLKSATEAYFEGTIEGAEKAIEYNNDYAASLATFKSKFKDLGKAVSDVWHYFIIGNAAAVALVTGQFDKFLKKMEIAAELSKVQVKLFEEQFTINQELAELELRRNEDIFKSRDALRVSDQERYEALLDQADVLREEIELKQKQNLLEQEEVKLKLQAKGAQVGSNDTASSLLAASKTSQLKIDPELLKELAALETEYIRIQGEEITKQRRQQAQLNTLLKERVDKELAADAQIEESKVTTANTVYKVQQDNNKRIVGNQQFTVEQQIEAERKLADSAVQLSSLEVTQKLNALKKTSLARIDLSTEELDAVFKASGKSLDKITALTIEAKNKKLAVDALYIAEAKAITEEGYRQEGEIVKDETDKIAKIIVGAYKAQIDIRKSFVTEDVNAELKALNQKFTAGRISVISYNKQKALLDQQAANESLDISIAESKMELAILEKFYKDNADITGEGERLIKALKTNIAEQELTRSQKEADKRVNVAERTKNKLIQINAELANAIQALGDAQYQALIQASQDRIDLLEKEKTKAIKLAGDNKNAQAQIERKFTADIDAETKKQNAIKRKQAVFDKRASEFKIISSVASGIAQAYSEFIYPVATVFAALIAAAGAIQIAAVEAAPLPSYAVGTTDHPGGAALVHPGELVNVGGKVFMTPNQPSVVDLPAHSEVLTSDETTRALAMAGVAGAVSNGGHKTKTVYMHDPAMIKSLDDIGKRIFDVHAHGNELMKVFRTRDGSRQRTRARWTDR